MNDADLTSRTDKTLKTSITHYRSYFLFSKIVNTVCEMEINMEQTVNRFSELLHKVHSVSVVTELHQHYSRSASTIFSLEAQFLNANILCS